jgi:hypothetical protein
MKEMSYSRTYHNVPSTSNTIPFKSGALYLLVRLGSSGANLRGRIGTVLCIEEDMDVLTDV